MTPTDIITLGRTVWNQPDQWRRALQERPALFMLLCNVMAQSIGVALAPVLTRLYTPEQFGVLGALTAAVMIGAPATSARFEMAVLRAREERTAWVALVLTFVTIAGMSILGGGLAFTATHLPGVAAGYREFWFFVPLGLASIAAYNTLAIEASRRGELQTLATSKLSQSTWGVGSQVLLGAAGAGSFGLLIGFLLNQSAGIIRLGRALVLQHPARGAVTWLDLASEAQRNRSLALYSTWSTTLEVASKWGLQLAVSILWSPVIGGYVFLADRIVGRPLLLLSTSLLPVYAADVSRALRSDRTRVWNVFKVTLRTQFFATFVWTACVLLAAPWVVVPVFGAGWADLVRYVQLITLALAPSAVAHAVAHTLQLAGKQRLEALLVTLKVATLLVVIGGGYVYGASALETLAGFAAVQFVFSIVVLAQSAKAAREMSE